MLRYPSSRASVPFYIKVKVQGFGGATLLRGGPLKLDSYHADKEGLVHILYGILKVGT